MIRFLNLPPNQFYCHLDNLRRLSGPRDSLLDSQWVQRQILTGKGAKNNINFSYNDQEICSKNFIKFPTSKELLQKNQTFQCF